MVGFDRFVIAEAPSAPENTILTTDAEGHPVLEWKAPADDGGADVIGYHIHLRHSGSTTWKKISTQIIRKCRYVVDNLKPGDEADAQVTAVNEKGEGQPSQPPVHIVMPEAQKPKEVPAGMEAPTVTIRKPLIEVPLSDSFTVEATLTGLPYPTTQWKFNDTVITETRRIKMEERKTSKMVKLTITKSETTDSGTYTITASNPAGDATATATVKVLTKPGLPAALRFDQVTGDSVKLIWTAPEDDGASLSSRTSSRNAWLTKRCGQRWKRRPIPKSLLRS